MDDNTQTIEIDEATAKEIAKHIEIPAAKEIDYAQVAEKLAAIQADEKAKQDKEVNKIATKKKAAEGEVVSEFDTMSKEAFLMGQLGAILSNDGAKLKEYNDHSLKTLEEKGYVKIDKATYLNVGTTADGGALVPNADLLEDIFTVLPSFSAAAGLLREITLVEGSSLDVATLTADVVMTEVGSEGGDKTVTKPTLGDGNIAVREFAGIALMTKKLLRQAAIDIYGVVRDSFARAIAKKREQLMLTDSSSGILVISGTVNTFLPTANAGNSVVSGITRQQVLNMPFQVPTESANGGTYVISRLLLGSMSNREDSTGQPVVTVTGGNDGGALSGRFSNGFPFVVAETMGTTDAASTYHAVFGNWRKYGILLRQGAVDSQVFDSGTVVDGSSVEHNLIQQNKVALRVEMWENVGYPIPGAFVKLRTTAAS